ncbi:MAG TPA: CDP-diacylglycerol--serine O-phosphatidyltransferase [Bacteroidales bacterium]|nr:CDP-diacylglycerol--serine O-phosphatidyltransferase [Bacteroidales bacterium]HPS16099.1 CDP-diacylglycerol--serine O-phosphatidyltransferase [Bacteroidales bacterium]
MKLYKHIPNFITSLNLLSGCIGIGLLFSGNIIEASCFIAIAAVFDFLDGFSAKLLKAQSAIGKDLDSLADVVSFGVLPGLIMFTMLNMCFSEAEGWQKYLPFEAFLIPVFSALRLAKFNNDENQTENFIGMPTPANALFIASIPFIILNGNESPTYFTMLFGNPGFLLALVIILSFLLVAPVKLFSLKFKSFGWKENEIRYIFLIVSLIALILLQYIAVPLIIIFYIILSLINYSKKNEIPR